MQKQHSFAKRDGRRAFTLVELVVAMALFAIVAGMVVSFIIFINRFSEKSRADGQDVRAFFCPFRNRSLVFLF